MVFSPPESPTPENGAVLSRPQSQMTRQDRSMSRLSAGSRTGQHKSEDDAKTAVKVAVRVRPPLTPNDPNYELIPPRFQRSVVQVTSPTSLAVESNQGRKCFVFDHVFDEHTGQNGVWEYVSDCVNSFVQGYNVSILAYGQSGAGKSYTMGTGGPAAYGDSENLGIIPRAAQSLFEKLNALSGNSDHNRSGSSGLRPPTRYSMAPKPTQTENKPWQLKATYVEIYNEQLRDLLIPDSIPLSDRQPVAIREDAKGRIFLTGLKAVDINSVDDIFAALDFGSAIRQTDATAINAQSSRSHAVFSLNYIWRQDATSGSKQEKRKSMSLDSMTSLAAGMGGDSASTITIDSKLHFVDLAGSERLKNTGASGERAKEGISINAGLASLGKVISQLSRHSGSAGHISYRDSKLTRLLQDSLGGNAITYMVACVTPVEFHLSETLNTVQYAQRARAIQLKPMIQQSAIEGGARNALIERLKAEIVLLRNQLAEQGTGDDQEKPHLVRNSSASSNRLSSEREIDLQNSLLDSKEKYDLLSQKYAKLVSQMSEASKTEGEDAGVNAVERLKRSHSFAESVEHVVLEYEKTIQSLESSLAQTRTQLAETENNLLERDTRAAYVETLNYQLRERLQKMTDRETANEQYLQALEEKLDDHASGEGKNAVVIAELRKEIGRVRENAASCEDYISTLEERLAEADQDTEFLQREIGRLEHVVERQRSLGKLDRLLSDLDGEDLGRKSESETAPSLGPSSDKPEEGSVFSGTSATASVDEEHTFRPPSNHLGHASRKNSQTLPVVKELNEGEKDASSSSDSEMGGQTLASVSRELVDLRASHEATVSKANVINTKYEESLKAMAEMQDAMDELRHKAAASNGKDPTATLNKHTSLPSANGIPASSLEDELGKLSAKDDTDEFPQHEDSAIGESKITSGSNDDARYLSDLLEKYKEDASLITQQYASLQTEHDETLQLVEELRASLSRYNKHGSASSNSSASPPPSSAHRPTPSLRRRPTGSNLAGLDRAHRSLAFLRNIAAEEFGDRPEMLSNFELNLNSTVHELHRRMEHIEALELESASSKTEMEAKAAIISGLTRERKNHAASTDMTIIAQMQEQVAVFENKMREMQEQHEGRERKLEEQIEELNSTMKEMQEVLRESEERVLTLEHESRRWEEKHNVVAESLSETERKLQSTIRQLDSTFVQYSEWERMHNSAADALDTIKTTLDSTVEELESTRKERGDMHKKYLTTSASLEECQRKLQKTLTDLDVALVAVEVLEKERDSSQVQDDQDGQGNQEPKGEDDTIMEDLKRDIRANRGSILLHLTKVDHLEGNLKKMRNSLEVNGQATLPESSDEVQSMRARMSGLDAEIEEHRNAAQQREAAIDELQKSHDKEVAMYEAKLKDSQAAHATSSSDVHDNQQQLSDLRKELEDSKKYLEDLLTSIGVMLGASVPTTSEIIQGRIQGILEQKHDMAKQVSELQGKNGDLANHAETKHELEQKVAALTSASSNQESKVQELALLVATLEETVSEKDALLAKKEELIENIETEKDKSARLVEELEDQISNSYDETNNRLSMVQIERVKAIEDANAKIVALEKDIESYRARITSLEGHASMANQERSNSITSTNLRKSGSATALPTSPPPAGPLPPLPKSVTKEFTVSPPSSNHTSKEFISPQVVEEQEARIRTIEKHLNAEKQLTASLEEALGDLEMQSNKIKADLETWKKKAWHNEDELSHLRSERDAQRVSQHAVEEERNARLQAEAARAHLEEKMNAINKKKKKKNAFNCF